MREREKVRRARLPLARYKQVTPRNGKYNAVLRKARTEFEAEFFKEAASTIEF
jgi:hypothetical protein